MELFKGFLFNLLVVQLFVLIGVTFGLQEENETNIFTRIQYVCEYSADESEYNFLWAKNR